MEDVPADHMFDLVTVGRALHWLDRGAVLQVLERIVSGRGCVLICGAARIVPPRLHEFLDTFALLAR
jgi:hypothetical protein